MKALLFLPLAACVSAQVVMPFGAYAPYAAAPYAAAPYSAAPYAAAPYAAPWAPKSQYHAQDELGQVRFGHTTLDQTRSEVRLWNGQVLGHYSYIDANGEPAVTYYEAGPNGFRVLGANNLPEGHAADKSVPDYTPEVAAARAEFAKTFEEAKAAAAAAPDVPATAEPQLKSADEPAAEAAAEPAPEQAAEPALAAEAEAAPEAAVKPVAEEEAAPSRRRRQAALPLPYLHAVPTTTKVSYTTSHLEPKEAATPADTMFLDKVTKEHEFAFPSVRYVQPTVKVQPITYANTAFSSFMPFAANPFMTSPFVTLKAE